MTGSVDACGRERRGLTNDPFGDLEPPLASDLR